MDQALDQGVYHSLSLPGEFSGSKAYINII